jgi:hypothetical protein
LPFCAGRLLGQQERLGIDELDLAGRHRAGTELVFQPPDPHPIAGSVAAGAQHQKCGDAARRVGGALGFGQYDERLAGAVGREPFESIQPPGIPAAGRGRFECSQVRAAGAFGQQLCRLARPFTRFELGQYVVAHVGRRVGGHQRLDHAATGAQRAAHPDIGLVE